MTIKAEMMYSPDTDALAAIHAACFDKGWDAQAIASMLAIAGTMAFVAPGHAAFGLVRCLGTEAEILTLAVPERHRRGGAGHAIVSAMVEWAKAQGAEAMLLEVNEHNTPALRLYEKNGFSVLSRRKKYYHNADGSHTDAIVMRRALGPS